MNHEHFELKKMQCLGVYKSNLQAKFFILSFPVDIRIQVFYGKMLKWFLQMNLKCLIFYKKRPCFFCDISL